MRSDGRAQHRTAACDEAIDASLEGWARHQHVPAARLAPDPDVGAETVHEPRAAAARVGAAEVDDIAQEKLEHGVAGHRGRG
jgi:hypothetical protein